MYFCTIVTECSVKGITSGQFVCKYHLQSVSSIILAVMEKQMDKAYTIRQAERKDVPLLLGFIRGIAKYEKLEVRGDSDSGNVGG